MDRKYLTQILVIAIVVVLGLLVWAVFFYNPGGSGTVIDDIANMSFEEFAEWVDDDGVFRGSSR